MKKIKKISVTQDKKPVPDTVHYERKNVPESAWKEKKYDEKVAAPESEPAHFFSKK